MRDPAQPRPNSACPARQIPGVACGRRRIRACSRQGQPQKSARVFVPVVPAICIHQSGFSALAKKSLALLTLQSLVFLPLLVLLTKSTVIVLAITVICGLIYVRSLPGFKPLNAWTLLVAVGALSALWSITPELSVERAAKLAVFLILLAGLIHVVSRWTEDDRRYIAEIGLKAWWVALAGAIPILIFETDLKAVISTFVSEEQAIHVRQVWKPVSNNAVVLLVVTAFPLFGRDLSTIRHKLYLALAVLGLLVAILQSGSNSALLGLIAGLAVWWLYSRYSRAMVGVLTVGLPIAVLAMPVFIYPLANNPEPIARSIPNFPNSFIHRLLIWDFTLERVAERPVLGWGLDTSPAIPGGTDLRPIHYVVPWLDKPITHPDQNLPLHPHNAVLQIWLELGLIGVAAFMFAIWTLLRTQLTAHRKSGPMAGFFVSAMAIYCVAYGLMQSWWIAFLFLGWAAAKAAEPPGSQPKVGQ